MAAIYSVDSSSLMDWQARHFPTDVFVGLASSMDALVGAGRLMAPALVREELDKVGTSGLKQWTDSHAGIFVRTGDLLAPAQAIQGQFPGLLDPRAEFEEADAYVIALAQLRDGIVVTQEHFGLREAQPTADTFHSRCLPGTRPSVHQPVGADAPRGVAVLVPPHAAPFWGPCAACHRFNPSSENRRAFLDSRLAKGSLGACR